MVIVIVIVMVMVMIIVIVMIMMMMMMMLVVMVIMTMTTTMCTGKVKESQGVPFTHALVSRFPSVDALRVYYQFAIKDIATKMRPWLKVCICICVQIKSLKTSMSTL